MSLINWTEDRIKALLTICDRATKGSWRYDEQADLILGDNDQAIVLEPRHECGKGKANAEFAAMARDVLPAILRFLLSPKTTYVVTALHSTGHGGLASVVMVTGDPKKALDTARMTEHMAYEFEDNSRDAVTVSKMTTEVPYDHLPGDIYRRHSDPTNSDAILYYREKARDWKQEGAPVVWKERFFNDWDKHLP